MAQKQHCDKSATGLSHQIRVRLGMTWGGGGDHHDDARETVVFRQHFSVKGSSKELKL